MREACFEDLGEALDYIRVLSKPVLASSELPPLSLYKPKPKDPVVNGDPVRTPVDKVAARVVSKAPDWAHYVAPATKDERYTKEKKTMKQEPDPVGNNLISQGGYGPHGRLLVGKKKDADFNIEVASEGAKHFSQNVTDTENLVKRAEEANAALDYLCSHIKREWIEYDDFIIGALKKVRATRVAIEIETKQTLAALGDIRKFFLDSRHEEEVEKLCKFVEVCERLRELKRSGFLDSVCDTILKLEER